MRHTKPISIGKKAGCNAQGIKFTRRLIQGQQKVFYHPNFPPNFYLLLFHVFFNLWGKKVGCKNSEKNKEIIKNINYLQIFALQNAETLTQELLSTTPYAESCRTTRPRLLKAHKYPASRHDEADIIFLYFMLEMFLYGIQIHLQSVSICFDLFQTCGAGSKTFWDYGFMIWWIFTSCRQVWNVWRLAGKKKKKLKTALWRAVVFTRWWWCW